MKGIVGNCLCWAKGHWIYPFPLTYVHVSGHFQCILVLGRDTLAGTATIQILWGNYDQPKFWGETFAQVRLHVSVKQGRFFSPFVDSHRSILKTSVSSFQFVWVWPDQYPSRRRRQQLRPGFSCDKKTGNYYKLLSKNSSGQSLASALAPISSFAPFPTGFLVPFFFPAAFSQMDVWNKFSRWHLAMWWIVSMMFSETRILWMVSGVTVAPKELTAAEKDL